jgi:hypothetical protein
MAIMDTLERPAPDAAAAASRNTLPTITVVIEWENARLSEAERARRMLRRLRAQLADLAPAMPVPPVVIFLYDPGAIEDGLIEHLTAEAAADGPWPAELRFVPSPGRAYYEQKNFGAGFASSEIVVFLDSDVVPEDGWLAALLEALRDPEVGVVCGNTYIELDSLYEKAFAAFWFFPLRDPRDDLAPSPHFFANNVAFRRELIARHPFPDLASFRGQCKALTRILEAEGIGIRIQRRARVSHPPPNGLRHFVVRAICEGYDEIVHGRQRNAAGRLAAVGYRFVRDTTRAAGRLVQHRRAVGLGPPGVVAALGIAGAYYTLKTLGGLVTVIAPGLIRRNFSI